MKQAGGTAGVCAAVSRLSQQQELCGSSMALLHTGEAADPAAS